LGECIPRTVSKCCLALLLYIMVAFASWLFAHSAIPTTSTIHRPSTTGYTQPSYDPNPDLSIALMIWCCPPHVMKKKNSCRQSTNRAVNTYTGFLHGVTRRRLWVRERKLTLCSTRIPIKSKTTSQSRRQSKSVCMCVCERARLPPYRLWDLMGCIWYHNDITLLTGLLGLLGLSKVMYGIFIWKTLF